MLSELEGAVLGLLERNQALTAYAIRREFERSPTDSWSASAGSIYPLVKRLIGRELISEERVEGDGRRSRSLEITRAGRAALADWVKDQAAGIFGPASDPLRTRGFALAAMSKADQRACLDTWREQTASVLQELQDELADDDTARKNGIDIVNLSAITQIEGRLRWIETWMQRLDGGD